MQSQKEAGQHNCNTGNNLGATELLTQYQALTLMENH